MKENAKLKYSLYENGGKGTILFIQLEDQNGEEYEYKAEADFDEWCSEKGIPENLDKDDERFENINERDFFEVYERENEDYRCDIFDENVYEFDRDTWQDLITDIVAQAAEDNLTFDVSNLEERWKYWKEEEN